MAATYLVIYISGAALHWRCTHCTRGTKEPVVLCAQEAYGTSRDTNCVQDCKYSWTRPSGEVLPMVRAL